MCRCPLILLLLIAFCDTSIAQRRRPGLGNVRPQGRVEIERDGDAANRRNDVEGAIWEFKVLETTETNRSTRTKMTGRFRIKQTSVFAVGKVEVAQGADNKASGNASEVMAEFDKNGDEKLNVTELDSLLESMRGKGTGQAPRRGTVDRAQGQPGGPLAQRIRPAQPDGNAGGERIGDLTKDASSEKTFRFDEDDDHPLSGIVVVRPDTDRRNGVLVGRYDEFANGQKKKRWRFEMRRIED